MTHNLISKKQNLTLMFLVFALAILTALAGCMCGCNKSADGYAAVVGDVIIYEDEITQQVQELRESVGCTSDSDWIIYLQQNDTSAKEIRETVINNKIEDVLVDQKAKEYNITVTDEEFNNYYAEAIAEYGGEEQFNQLLAQQGISLDYYKDTLKGYYLQQKVNEKIAQTYDIPDSIKEEFVIKYGSDFNGSRGYYQIVASTDRASEIDTIYSQIKSGQKTFVEACKEYTATDPLGVNFDYVAYDKVIQNPDEVSQKLQSMQVGDMCEPLNTGGYVYLFYIDDVVECPEPLTFYDDLPQKTKDNLDTYVRNTYAQQMYTIAMEDAYNENNVVIYDMPGGLPYSTGSLF